MSLSPFAAWKEALTKNSRNQDMCTTARISHKIGMQRGGCDLLTDGAPEVNKSRLYEVPKRDRVIFHMG